MQGNAQHGQQYMKFKGLKYKVSYLYKYIYKYIYLYYIKYKVFSRFLLFAKGIKYFFLTNNAVLHVNAFFFLNFSN